MKAESKDGFLYGKKLLKETWLRVKGSHKWLEATIKTEGGSNPPGSFFNNLLVPPLNRALPLIQPQSIAVFISQHLYIKKKTPDANSTPTLWERRGSTFREKREVLLQ